MLPASRRLPSAGFLFALFCFLLPFLTVSCPGGSHTFSGLDLATGASIEQPQVFGATTERAVAPDPLVLGALLLTLVALGLCLRGDRSPRRAAAVCGAIAVGLLVLLKGRVDWQVQQQGHGLLEVSFGLGYWLALLAATAASTLAVAMPSTSRSSSSAQLPKRAAATASGAP